MALRGACCRCTTSILSVYKRVQDAVLKMYYFITNAHHKRNLSQNVLCEIYNIIKFTKCYAMESIEIRGFLAIHVQFDVCECNTSVKLVYGWAKDEIKSMFTCLCVFLWNHVQF